MRMLRLWRGIGVGETNEFCRELSPHPLSVGPWREFEIHAKLIRKAAVFFDLCMNFGKISGLELTLRVDAFAHISAAFGAIFRFLRARSEALKKIVCRDF